MKKQEKQNNSKLKIIPLGGLEQIGMNITAFEYEDSIIVVDCGLAFPEDDMYGVDLVIPDVTYLKENIDRVKGFFITHGHEDHIAGEVSLTGAHDALAAGIGNFLHTAAHAHAHAVFLQLLRRQLGKLRLKGGEQARPRLDERDILA